MPQVVAVSQLATNVLHTIVQPRGPSRGGVPDHNVRCAPFSAEVSANGSTLESECLTYEFFTG